MAATRLMLLFLVSCGGIHVVYSVTDPSDVTVLQSLKNQWENTPPSWGKSDDPCGMPWDEVNRSSSRVISLYLSNMGLKGTLGGDIRGLTELSTFSPAHLFSSVELLSRELGSYDLDSNLSVNGTLTFAQDTNEPKCLDTYKEPGSFLQSGPDWSFIFEVRGSEQIEHSGCGFTGNIPHELGNLKELTFLALNSNNFTGGIPPSLGNLSELYWLDVADNQLTGSIPVSTATAPGLDLLLKAEHL
ncbi:hypothetical protein Ancab_006529 [Ancistrocladus abbreviatus]